MTDAATGTRRFVAGILGLLGVMVLLDVLVVALVHPEAHFDGVRQLLLVLVGALLVLGGAVSFAWPQRASVETTNEGNSDASAG